jgi:hypothetical protein
MVNAIGIVKKLRPGDDVDSYCGKCKEEREHAIVALNEQGGIERVQCRTCQSTHLYRNKQKASAKTRSTKEKSVAAAVETGPARTYSMQSRFRIGERISHPKFGLGTVIDERSGKIDVRFGKDVRTLIHAG